MGSVTKKWVKTDGDRDGEKKEGKWWKGDEVDTLVPKSPFSCSDYMSFMGN